MRKECTVGDVARQQAIEFTTPVHHQRKVCETVGMIVHVVAVEEEGSILRLSHEMVPFFLAVGCIGYYLEHPT